MYVALMPVWQNSLPNTGIKGFARLFADERENFPKELLIEF